MRTVRWAVLGVWVAALIMGAALPGQAEDAGAKTAALSAKGTIRDALLGLGEGRDVELVLTNGKSYRGKLGAVGSETVIVSQIAGKELYDALIDLDEVAAVEIRARGN